MKVWTLEELQRIVAADDLRISPLRMDGVTHGTPTWIWCVSVANGLYVRGYHGQRSRWYQAAITQGAGRIHAAGAVYDVTFEAAPDTIGDEVDAAYRAKYAMSNYLAAMVGAPARSATVRITPSR
jgi:hypothetical protein